MSGLLNATISVQLMNNIAKDVIVINVSLGQNLWRHFFITTLLPIIDSMWTVSYAWHSKATKNKECSMHTDTETTKTKTD